MKYIFIAMAAFVCSMSMNAQQMKVMKGNVVIATYSAEEADKVVFEEVPTDSRPAGSYGTTGGHSWVQLWKDGPKWAEFNVGATITDYANLSTTTGDRTTDQGYVAPYTTENVGGLYPWLYSCLNGRTTTWKDNITLSAKNDIATSLWGNNWCEPTKEQLEALTNGDNTELTWCDGSTTQYVKGCSLAGLKISGKAGSIYKDNSIFLPAAGNYNYEINNNSVAFSGNVGYYWASTKKDKYAYYLGFFENVKCIVDDFVYIGKSVRAVLK